MQPLTFCVPWPPAALSPNARVHALKRHSVGKAYRRQCWALAMEAGAALHRAEAKAADAIALRLDFHPATRRGRDDDNFTAAFKAGRDGIADALAIDDSRFRVVPVMHGFDPAIPQPFTPSPFQKPRAAGHVRVTLGGPIERTDA